MAKLKSVSTDWESSPQQPSHKINSQSEGGDETSELPARTGKITRNNPLGEAKTSNKSPKPRRKLNFKEASVSQSDMDVTEIEEIDHPDNVRIRCFPSDEERFMEAEIVDNGD